MLTLRDLPKGEVKKSARHILKMAKDKNHTVCKKCKSFIDYSKKSMLRDVSFTTISL